MGWKAIKSLNKQEHLDREASALVAKPAEEVVSVPKNAIRELPLSETHEVITGPGGWIIGVPFESEVPFEAISEITPVETTVVAPEVSILPVNEPVSVTVAEEPPVKKSPPKKKKVAAEPT